MTMTTEFKVGQKVAYKNSELAKQLHPAKHPEYRGIVRKINGHNVWFMGEYTKAFTFDLKVFEEPKEVLPYKKGDIIKYAMYENPDGTKCYNKYTVANCFSFKENIYVCFNFQNRLWVVNVKDLEPVISDKKETKEVKGKIIVYILSENGKYWEEWDSHDDLSITDEELKKQILECYTNYYNENYKFKITRMEILSETELDYNSLTESKSDKNMINF